MTWSEIVLRPHLKKCLHLTDFCGLVLTWLEKPKKHKAGKEASKTKHPLKFRDQFKINFLKKETAAWHSKNSTLNQVKCCLAFLVFWKPWRLYEKDRVYFCFFQFVLKKGGCYSVSAELVLIELSIGALEGQQWHTSKTGLVLQVEAISSFSLLIFFNWFSTHVGFSPSHYHNWEHEAIS